ncbi:hypothetical protein TGAM01_v203789 [Trichoderma gamsii]|uniref:Uncharacterized protein n=1 Tax=Trichoderma gamsii TaxID=398673 RepID=A0A2P4ZT04_9HYPO|nr:hypothetical protein TGAM01_v203789 [Trichoderma gamsii]PON27408.1 hypothetical protein TGAM01_v203789 [Trichoderma gamsii]
MRHNPATTLLLALGAVLSTARADNDNPPVPKSGLQQSWASPAKETVTSGHEIEQQVALGWSPKPTQPPKPLFGRMMMPRADGYTLGPETCGFVPGNDGNSYTCISSGYTCTPQGGHVGCCQPNSSCSQIKTTCIDYKASQTGACNLPSDFHTLCCASTEPACYTWVISTSASTDKAVELYTIFGCSLTAGRGTLLTVDPGWLATHSFGSTTTTASTASTESASATSTPDSNSGKSSTPVGAIAGGTVGGVAALGLVGLAAFLLYRHRNPRNTAPPAGQPPQGQNNAAGGAVYPSGVPAGYAPVPMQQQGYYPQQFQGQYPPQQQQYNYNYPAQTASTSPVHTTPSPGVFKEGEATATELPTTSPLGAETNRAELGVETDRAELGGGK